MKDNLLLKQLLYGSLLSILFSACSTTQTSVTRSFLKLSYSPVGNHYEKWEDKKLVSAISEDSVVVEVVFQQATNQYLIFDIWVLNYSNAPCIVAPERFYYEAVQKDTLTAIGGKRYAHNPEQMILNLAKEESRVEARKKNNSVGGIILGATVLGVTGLLMADDPAYAIDFLAYDGSAIIEENQFNREEIRFQMGSLQEEKWYWEKNTIRKTTLAPNYELSGSVFFPQSGPAPFIFLDFQINGKEVPFLFQLTR